MRFTLFSTLILALLLSAGNVAAEGSLRAELDRDEVRLGDTVTLTLTLEGAANMARPQLEPLTEDFQVLSTSQRSSTRWTGGQSEATSSWIVVLAPMREGELQVPAIQAGDATSRPLSLTVTDEPGGTPATEGEDVFVTLSVDPEQGPYHVGQQFRLTLSLFHAVPLVSGELTDLEIDGARVERLGEDNVYESRRGQRVYRVIERRFSVVPERSGEMTVPAIRFSGRAGSRANSFFGDRGRLVNARSESLTFDIPALQPGAPQLAARRLSLTDSLDQQPLQLQVGEALSREIVIEAEGVYADQLPELTMPPIDGLRSYADKPVRETGHNQGWLQAEQRQRLAVIALEPGEYQLPPIEVAWFDVREQRERVARLPARTLTVLPAAAASDSTSSPDEMETEPVAGFWPWLAAGLGLLWLATSVAWWWSTRSYASRQDGEVISEEVTATLRYARRQLATAARSGDHEACQEALMMWSRAERLGCRSLSELADRVQDADMAEAIRSLDRARFGPAPGQWQAPEVFLQPPERLSRETASADRQQALPPLYTQGGR